MGNDVQFTTGVRISTHGYSCLVLKKAYGPIVGIAGKVKIGNNVIIRVGSLLKGKIPDNSVVTGVSYKPIIFLDNLSLCGNKEESL